jgi:hypothetical protein
LAKLSTNNDANINSLAEQKKRRERVRGKSERRHTQKLFLTYFLDNQQCHDHLCRLHQVSAIIIVGSISKSASTSNSTNITIGRIKRKQLCQRQNHWLHEVPLMTSC